VIMTDINVGLEGTQKGDQGMFESRTVAFLVTKPKNHQPCRSSYLSKTDVITVITETCSTLASRQVRVGLHCVMSFLSKSFSIAQLISG